MYGSIQAFANSRQGMVPHFAGRATVLQLLTFRQSGCDTECVIPWIRRNDLRNEKRV